MGTYLQPVHGQPGSTSTLRQVDAVLYTLVLSFEDFLVKSFNLL